MSFLSCLPARRITPLLTLSVAAFAAVAAAQVQTGHAPSSRPVVEPAEPRAFQPGVLIDWRRRAVIVQSRVVLRRGQLEFLACFSGKEHESILRMDASAAHVYMALGLIGLDPGHPPTWNEAVGGYGLPAGDLVDIECEWQQEGQRRTANAFDWLLETEYARTPLQRPWVFAGSIRLPDGSLAADHSGVGVALVDFPDSLLSLSRGHPSRLADLWAQARTAAIPPLRTPVRLILRPAQARERHVEIDFRGQTIVDGRFTALADLADLLKLARQLQPQRVQTINVKRALRSDVRRAREGLVRHGLPAEAVRFRGRSAATTSSTTRPAADE